MTRSSAEIIETDRVEEVFNALTHGLGFFASLIGFGILLWMSLEGTAWHIVSVSIYATTLVMLYAASTIYHWVSSPDLRKLFRFLDHSCIYLLIAGTYTPFALLSLKGAWGMALFTGIWMLAIFGIVFKYFSAGRYVGLSTGLYVAMGWAVVMVIEPLILSMPPESFTMLWVGGLAYTGGVYFYLHDKKKFNHAVWHCFVLTGSTCHFFSIIYLLP